jgi:hypothetical protein
MRGITERATMSNEQNGDQLGSEWVDEMYDAGKYTEIEKARAEGRLERLLSGAKNEPKKES